MGTASAAPPGRESDPEIAEEAGGALRVENEYKLSVPDAELEPLREHLRRRYGTGEGSILPEFGPEFSVTFSDEAFVDRYFDTPDLAVLQAEGGVRHRARHNLGDPTTDRKHGRELVQLKLRRPGDQLLNRTEIKFKVDPPGNAKTELDRHPLIGLVKREQQPAIIETLKQYGFDARRMAHTITINQRRWRVYVSRRGSPFATLTLDEVKSYWTMWNVDFVELEIELNEIAYTESGAGGRQEMESFSHRMAQDILTTFPSIRQDQTPKYNKVYNAFGRQLPRFDVLVVHGDEIVTGTLVGAPLLIMAIVAGVREVRRRRRGEHRRTL